MLPEHTNTQLCLPIPSQYIKIIKFHHEWCFSFSEKCTWKKNVQEKKFSLSSGCLCWSILRPLKRGVSSSWCPRVQNVTKEESCKELLISIVRFQIITNEASSTSASREWGNGWKMPTSQLENPDTILLAPAAHNKCDKTLCCVEYNTFTWWFSPTSVILMW